VIKHIVLKKALRIARQLKMDITLQYHWLGDLILAEGLPGTRRSKLS
jgi:hypothetical protein